MMSGYVLVLLKDIIESLGEDSVKAILSDFSCPINKDVENFIRKKAIEFNRQGIAVTHLVFTSYKQEYKLIAYFTLSLKYFTISTKSFSSNLKRRIRRFTTYNNETKIHSISAPLIAQLGKNYTDGYNSLISGDELLKLACDKVAKIQNEVGGKIVYLECEDNPKLLNFYNENGFVSFGKRFLDGDEASVMSGEYLIQMIKYL